MADDRERLAAAEAEQLRSDISLLREMRATAGESEAADGIHAALAQREERLAAVESGAAAPRGYSPAKSVAAGLDGPLLTKEHLRTIFEFYCNFGRTSAMSYQDTMDSFMFMKFARECPGLLDSHKPITSYSSMSADVRGLPLTPTEVDLIFVKAKPKFERRLDFEHFLDALSAIAERKYPDARPADGLRILLTRHLVPLYELVLMEMQKTADTEVPQTGVFKKLNDPRYYTGVYAERFRSGDGRINGDTATRAGRAFTGSTNTGTDEVIHDVSVLMRPNLHGAGTMMSPSNHALKRNGSSRGLSSAGSTTRLTSPPAARSRPPSAAPPTREAREAAASATPGGAAALPFDVAAQSAALAAAMERAKAGDASELMSLTVTLAEQIKSFQERNASMRAAVEGSPAGPAAAGSRAFASPAGSPAPRDEATLAAARAEIEELEADIAHLKEALTSGSASAEQAHELRQSIRDRTDRIAALRAGTQRATAIKTPKPLPSSMAKRTPQVFTFDEAGRPQLAEGASVASNSPALTQEQLHEVFEFYCNFGRSSAMTYQDSLDNFMFMKFARECPGLMDRKLNATEIDLIFVKAKPKFERRLQFTHFLDALSAIAERKFPEYKPADGLRMLLANHLVPHYEIVQLEMQKTGDTEIPLTGIYKKLYDVRNYTGVYAERFRTGDGRINGETDTRAGRAFTGSTNTGTDEIIHDISVLMRPNLRSGSMMRSRPVTPGGSPGRLAARSVSPRRAPSMGPGGFDGRSVAGSVRGR